jgi:uncharacterized membrane protein
MEIRKLPNDKYLLAIAGLALVSIIYLTMFAVNAYNTYHEYLDVGGYAFDMYQHIHYAGTLHGLQYLIFSNHITPDSILLLPFFAIWQSAITLLLLQAIILSLTGVVVFLVARDLLKSEKIALMLGAAFLLNPGMHGMMVFDFHSEMFLPLFVILTFYFAAKNRPVLFAISLLLLLGAIDVAPIVALALGAGLVFYALFREHGAERRRWLLYSTATIIMSLAVLGFYGFVVSSLVSSYASNAYPSLPLMSEVMPFLGGQISSLGGSGTSFSSAYYMLGGYLLYALALVLLGFGVAALFAPVATALFIAPWLAEIFVVKTVEFIFIWNQYFSYALGGIVVATILSMKAINENRNWILRHVFRDTHRYHRYIAGSIIALSLLLFIISPYFVRSKNVNNLSQDFLFSVNSTVRPQIAALDSIVKAVPANASLMAPGFAIPHLFRRQYIEPLPSDYGGYALVQNSAPHPQVWGMGFEPDYILVDFNPYISLNAFYGNQVQNFLNITGATYSDGRVEFNGSYSVYAYNGSALLLKRNLSRV